MRGKRERERGIWRDTALVVFCRGLSGKAARVAAPPASRTAAPPRALCPKVSGVRTFTRAAAPAAHHRADLVKRDLSRP
jgi:hypothetical protein